MFIEAFWSLSISSPHTGLSWAGHLSTLSPNFNLRFACPHLEHVLLVFLGVILIVSRIALSIPARQHTEKLS